MDAQQFWTLVDDARGQVADPADAEAVADRAIALLAARPLEDIVDSQRVQSDLMGTAYTTDVWAAAYEINSGSSFDGFEYFRAWLMTRGREVFERAVADPDTLADLPAVRTRAGAWGAVLNVDGGCPWIVLEAHDLAGWLTASVSRHRRTLAAVADEDDAEEAYDDLATVGLEPTGRRIPWVPAEPLRRSADPDVREFALTLPTAAWIADLRTAEPGTGSTSSTSTSRTRRVGRGRTAGRWTTTGSDATGGTWSSPPQHLDVLGHQPEVAPVAEPGHLSSPRTLIADTFPCALVRSGLRPCGPAGRQERRPLLHDHDERGRTGRTRRGC